MALYQDITFISVGTANNNKHSYFQKLGHQFRDINDILNEAFNKPSRIVVLTGGEPLIHPKIFPILHSISKNGAKRIIILTNGRMCFYEKFCKKLNKFPVELIIECSGSNRLEHNDFTGTENGFDQTITSINNCILNKIRIYGHIPFIGDVANKISIWKALGISRFVLTAVDNTEINPTLLQQIETAFPFQIFNNNLPRCLTNLDHFPLTDIKQFKEECNFCDYNKTCAGVHKSYPATPIKNILEKLKIVQSEVIKNCLNFISLDELFSILYAIAEHKNIWKIIEVTGTPIHIFDLIYKSLIKNNFISIQEKNLLLTNPLPRSNPAKDFSKYRQPSDPNSCQLTINSQAVEDRTNYIAKSCPTGGKIAFIGDDDFISITLASTNTFQEIVVFDIDERITKTLNNLAKEFNYPLTAIRHDLKNPINEYFQNRFDAFYTDSPYTIPGFKLFLSRGVELLKKIPKKQGFQAFTPKISSPEKVELPAQQIISDMGLLLVRKNCPASNEIPADIKDKFSSGTEIRAAIENHKNLPINEKWAILALGRKEYLNHYHTTVFTKPLITEHFFEPIFHDDKINLPNDRNLINELKQHNKEYQF